MKTFNCLCGNSLFFENSWCVKCQQEVGWCPQCSSITTLIPKDNSTYQCGHTECQTLLVKCHNNTTYQVCNRYIAATEIQQEKQLCDCCRYNHTIPDLSVEGNLQRWYKLEVAKRRLLYTLDLIGLPFGNKADGFDPPLAFDFKGDVLLKDNMWRTVGKTEHVYTGHDDGKITINIQEADDAEREKLRVDMNEAQRTLVGHFHHEIGHYYWQAYVKNEWLDRFKEVFGDHENPNYSEAQQKYYQEGAPSDWANNYISAYATMHPWEDFAETFAAYLDMISVLDTAKNMTPAMKIDVGSSYFDSLVAAYAKIGIMLNEMNRTLGLLDFVPEVLTPAVIEKMRYVHELVRSINKQEKVKEMAISA